MLHPDRDLLLGRELLLLDHTLLGRSIGRRADLRSMGRSLQLLCYYQNILAHYGLAAGDAGSAVGIVDGVRGCIESSQEVLVYDHGSTTSEIEDHMVLIGLNKGSHIQAEVGVMRFADKHLR